MKGGSMDIAKARDRVAETIQGLFPDATVGREYAPLMAVDEGRLAVNVQPTSFAAEFADRDRDKVQCKITVTLGRAIGRDRTAACDALLEDINRLVNAGLGARLGPLVVLAAESPDPLLAEDQARNATAAIGRVVLTLHGMDTRGGRS